MEPIGYIESPYLEKFAVPRQPGLAPSAIGFAHLIGPAGHPDAIRGLEQFSHIWVLFQFHQTQQQGWQPLVRPPRLGGNQKVGVFASRSTFRPNSIGMSLVELVACEHSQSNGQPSNRLTLRGLDLVDGTPILDIKPYLPYAESLPDARAGYAQSAPISPLNVEFTSQAFEQLKPQTRQLVQEVLQQDPRPAYQREQIGTRRYGVKLAGFDIQFDFPAPGLIQVLNAYPL